MRRTYRHLQNLAKSRNNKAKRLHRELIDKVKALEDERDCYKVFIEALGTKSK